MIIGAYGEQIEKRDFLKPILEKIKCYVDFRGHIQVNKTFWVFFLFNQRVWNELINHIIEDLSPLSTVHICKRYTFFLLKGVLILSYDSI